jgi:polar amino acid transport system permease protein
VLLTFVLNTTAYQAEIYKTAIESIPRGQREAAESLGLKKSVTFWKIIFPQAMITALRPLGNEIILMIKGSAVASLVTVFDLMGATKLAFSRTFDFNVYLWAAIIYFTIVEALRRTWDWVEVRLTRHLVR